jgi:hypothetical protein
MTLSESQEGLCIDKKTFMDLKTPEKMCILFENQLETLKLVRSYKFHQRLQYLGMGLLFTLGTYLLTLHLRP